MNTNNFYRYCSTVLFECLFLDLLDNICIFSASFNTLLNLTTKSLKLENGEPLKTIDLADIIISINVCCKDVYR